MRVGITHGPDDNEIEAEVSMSKGDPGGGNSWDGWWPASGPEMDISAWWINGAVQSDPPSEEIFDALYEAAIWDMEKDK